MSTFAFIAAAGTGSRFARDVPKQYASLAGRPVIAHAIERVAAAFGEASLTVLLAPDDTAFERSVGAMPGVGVIRCGAATRAATVRNGLDAIRARADDDDWVLVHDAARPCVDAASLARLRDTLSGEPVGALLAVPVTATLKRDDGEGRTLRTEGRAGLWTAQTPQVFRYRLLAEALARADLAVVTDEAQAIEALGLRARLVDGAPTNLKVTYAADLALAEAILAVERAGTPRP